MSRDVGYFVTVYKFRAGEAFEFLGQFDRHTAVLCSYHADIIVGEFFRVRDSARDVQLLIQLAGHDGVIVAFEFQSVVQGGHFMVLAVFIFVDDAGGGFTVFAIYAGFPLSCADFSARPVFSVQSDLAVNAVFARCPCFTE